MLEKEKDSLLMYLMQDDCTSRSLGKGGTGVVVFLKVAEQ